MTAQTVAKLVSEGLVQVVGGRVTLTDYGYGSLLRLRQLSELGWPPIPNWTPISVTT